MVSIMLSPLLMLLDEAVKLSVVAPRFRAAMSNEKRVRVEFSKKASAMRLPLSTGSGELPPLVRSCLCITARSRMAVMVSAGRPCSPVRCFKRVGSSWSIEFCVKFTKIRNLLHLLQRSFTLVTIGIGKVVPTFVKEVVTDA